MNDEDDKGIEDELVQGVSTFDHEDDSKAIVLNNGLGQAMALDQDDAPMSDAANAMASSASTFPSHPATPGVPLLHVNHLCVSSLASFHSDPSYVLKMAMAPG